MSDRGEYRSCYVAMADDADIHAMSGVAFKAFWMLKLSLPATGIGVVYVSKLADQVGCTKAELDAALAELEAPKPGSDHGWIARERNVVWIIGALANEPHLSPANRKKHLPFVHRLVAQLDQKLAIVAAFKRHYAEWFDGFWLTPGKATGSPPDASRNPSDTPSHAYPEPIDTTGDPPPESVADTSGKARDSLSDSLSKQKPIQEVAEQSSGSGDLDQERPARDEPGPAAAAAAPPKSERPKGDAGPPLPDELIAFCAEFYGGDKASAQRKRDVLAQLRAVLNGGCPFEGALLRATPEQLAAKARDVVLEHARTSLDDPDAAIVVLFRKLGDSTVRTEARLRDEARERAAEDAEHAALERDVDAWLAAHPYEGAAIEAWARSMVPSPTLPGARRMLILGEVRKRLAAAAAGSGDAAGELAEAVGAAR